MTVVKTLARADAQTAARWERFVLDCPSATFFHRAAWQDVIAEVFRHPTHYLYAEVDGQITGVLPLAHVKSLLFGNALVSLPFAVYGGVAADSEAAAERTRTPRTDPGAGTGRGSPGIAPCRRTPR